MVEARLLVAREFLADAGLCLDNGRFRSSVSRAYYGVFHACVALLSIMVIGPATFPDVVNGLPGGGNTALSRGISLLSSCTNEG